MSNNQHITLPNSGLDCPDCARNVEAAVACLPGVTAAQLNFASSHLSMDYDLQQVKPAAFIATVRELGHDVAPGEELDFELQGLDCADCAVKLQQAVAALPNVIDAQVVFATAQMHVSGVAAADLQSSVVQRAAELGYQAQLKTAPGAQAATPRRDWRTTLSENRHNILTAVSGTLLGMALLMHWLSVAPLLVNATHTLAIVAGGYYIARSGWAALHRTHSLDMNALMSIAALGAMAIGEWEEGATAMFLFSLGNTLEALTMDRARQAIRKLVQLSPREATRVHGGRADRVPVEQLRVGDLIEVKPGERVPMDGVVQQGSSTLDQAPITGESSPVDAASGSTVFAGSINGHGGLLVEVTKLAKDNTLSRIVQMVQEAQSRRAPAQRFVDTFARYYTPSVIALAAGVAVLPPLLLAVPFSTWFYRALVLLVIACPCALVISTPVAIVSAISNAARRGVLIKGGMHLEAIGRVHAVAFDKTGTLTEGKAAVTDVEPVGSSDPLADAAALRDGAAEPVDRLLALAASIEAHSQHPVARAVCDEAQRRRLSLLSIQDYQELTGHGAQARINGHTYYVGKHQLFCERVPHAQRVCQRVDELEAQGKTTILVGNERDVLGVIAVADRVRDTSASVVQTLRSLGVAQSVLLSGDNERTAQAIARLAGIDHVQANLLPQDKVAAVEGLLAQYGQVAMVGDGVNDAPALARSSVGIAMGAAGSDAALETADIVLMSDDLRRIPYVIRLGRRTLGRIRENIMLSLVIKGVFLLLAVGGFATLWMAVFADMGTSLIVTLNGMRLLREE